MSEATETPNPLETAVAELLVAIGQIFRRLRAEVKSSELSLSQTMALARLEKVGWMTTADLARAEAVKPQSMGATVADLEQEGLVQRRPHPTDGRQVLFALTDAGVEARRKRDIAKREWLHAAVGKLSAEEQRTLIAAAALIKRLADS